VAEARQAVDLPPWYREPTFGQRLSASLADGLLLLAVGAVVSHVVRSTTPFRVVMLGITGLYVVGGVALTGRTIGKRLLSLRVVDLGTGELPDLRAAVVRWFVPVVPSLAAIALPGLGRITGVAALAIYWGVLRGPLHRGLHDHAAGTVVTTRMAD
jgi:uncharacterized RDD family membrane protein YckC